MNFRSHRIRLLFAGAASALIGDRVYGLTHVGKPIPQFYRLQTLHILAAEKLPQERQACFFRHFGVTTCVHPFSRRSSGGSQAKAPPGIKMDKEQFVEATHAFRQGQTARGEQKNKI